MGGPSAVSGRALGAGDCEAWRDGPIGQPTNTVTSLGLVVAGVWLAGRARIVTPGRRWRPTGYSALLVAAGLGSVAYHGVGGRGSERLHDGALGAVLLATAVGEVAGVPARPTVDAALPSTVPTRSRRRRRTTRVLAATATAAPVAYALGRTSAPTCRPTSRWQWHGLWHVLVAGAAAAWGERTLVRPHLPRPAPTTGAEEVVAPSPPVA